MIGTVSMLDIFLIILLVDNGINKIKQILCRYMRGKGCYFLIGGFKAAKIQTAGGKIIQCLIVSAG